MPTAQIINASFNIAFFVLQCYNNLNTKQGGDIVKAVETLPEGYREFYSVDLQKNKKMSLFVNLLAIIIGAVMLVPMHFLVPISCYLLWIRVLAVM